MYRRPRKLTAESRWTLRKEFSIIKYPELCDLCASVVKKRLLLWLRPRRAASLW